MRKFEYLTRPIMEKHELSDTKENEWKPEGLLQTKLNELGEKGWELVNITKLVSHQHRTLYHAIFKREIHE